MNDWTAMPSAWFGWEVWRLEWANWAGSGYKVARNRFGLRRWFLTRKAASAYAERLNNKDQPMSSEMREMVEALAAKWERIAAERGVVQFTGNDHLLFANELRALLARTEAGADGVVAWRVEWDEDNDGDAFYVTLDTERGAIGRANEAIAEGFKGVRIRRLVYGDTRPQDASGDAEVDEKMKAIVAEYNDLIRHMCAGGDFFEFQAAMQAKEAK